MSLIPLTFLLYCYQYDRMSANPYEFLMNVSGHCAVVFFIISYAVVPLRRWFSALCKLTQKAYGKRLSDWNFLIFNRRMLGLNSFYYASIHLAVYLYFELDFDWQLLFDELTRYFISVAWVAMIILTVLAITSLKWMQKKLKKKWYTIHRSVDVLAILLPLHIYLQATLPDKYFWLYLVFCLLLISHRIAVAIVPNLFNPLDNGEQVNR